MDTDSLSDEVFEEDHPNPKYVYHNNDGLDIHEPLPDEQTPSPTGYPGYKPPKEALRLYALETDYFKGKKAQPEGGDTEDGWRSYQIEEDNAFDDTVVHKVREEKKR